LLEIGTTVQNYDARRILLLRKQDKKLSTQNNEMENEIMMLSEALKTLQQSSMGFPIPLARVFDQHL
jgi:hypothetical protein